MSIPSFAKRLGTRIDRTTIQSLSTKQSFTRGENYDREGAVAVLTMRGNSLQAEVEGTEPIPYRVMVQSVMAETSPPLIAPVAIA